MHQLEPRLKEAGFKVPGPTELFGGLVFSHELIHAIGGDEDTNKNMTRRLLLVLESAPIAVARSESVRNRIILGILHRYVEEDAGFLKPDDSARKIPRFLLNDVVRFCVPVILESPVDEAGIESEIEEAQRVLRKPGEEPHRAG